MVKVTEFTADTSPTGDDLLMGINDPAGTPANRKWTLDNTLNYGLTRTQTWSGNNTFSADVWISFNTGLYLDGGGDTYIVSDATNVIHFIAGGVSGPQIDSAGDIVMQNGDRIYLDGKGDTYLEHPSADVAAIMVGGAYGIYLDENATEVNFVPGAFNALATTATDGFIYVPTMAGTPTGNTTDYTGKTAMVWDSTGQKLWFNTTAATWVEVSGGGGGGHTIKEEGTPLTARAGLNFVGGIITATDDAGNDETDVTISGTKTEFDATLEDGTFAFLNQGNTFTVAQTIDVSGINSDITLGGNNVLADDTVIADIKFQAGDEVPAAANYAKITATMESDAIGSEDGSLKISVMEANVPDTLFMTFNDASSGYIGLQKPTYLPTSTHLYFDGGGDTGIYESAADSLTLQSGGTDGITVTNNDAEFNRYPVMMNYERIYLEPGKLSWIAEEVADGVWINVGGEAGLRLYEIGTEINAVIGANNVLATTATNGFVYIPTMAGDATGTPSSYTGKTPIAWDSTNNELKVYSGGAWRTVASVAQ